MSVGWRMGYLNGGPLACRSSAGISDKSPSGIPDAGCLIYRNPQSFNADQVEQTKRWKAAAPVNCKGRHIPSATLDEIVLINLKQRVLAPDRIADLLKSLTERQVAKSESADRRLLSLRVRPSAE